MTLTNLHNLINEVFPDWDNDNIFPSGLNFIEQKENITITSRTWSSSEIRRARLCQLVVPDKFTAETVVIYPSNLVDAPIFGCEYLRIGNKKFFGGVDFHPLSQEKQYLERYIDSYLHDMQDTEVETSKFYDLSMYFSKKFWLKKYNFDFYGEFYSLTYEYLLRYKKLLEDAIISEDVVELHKKYDTHMGENDPAHGILKAYFSEEFAEFYIKKFLFNLIGDSDEVDC